MIDIYCERTGPAFWSEPVNALTNLSFLVAFLLLAPVLRRHWSALGNANRIVSVLLMGLLLAICIGSFAFHTLASKPAMLADVIPISLFQLVFLTAYMHLAMGWGRLKVIAAMSAFFALSALCNALPIALNGSQTYLAALIFLSVLAASHNRHSQSHPKALWLAVACFTLALCFRTLDQLVCPLWPLGLHFLWHLTNGVVLYLCIQAYLARLSIDALK